MLKVERISVMNFENAIRGARNPLNSWDRYDSHVEPDGTFVLGPNDLSLARKLAKAGSDHRKFLRQVLVSKNWSDWRWTCASISCRRSATACAPDQLRQ